MKWWIHAERRITDVVKLSIGTHLIELIRKNERFHLKFVWLLCGEAMDSLQFSLELLLYSEWFSIKLLNELGSYQSSASSSALFWVKKENKMSTEVGCPSLSFESKPREKN